MTTPVTANANTNSQQVNSNTPAQLTKEQQDKKAETLAASDAVLKEYGGEQMYKDFAALDGNAEMSHYERVLMANAIETKLQGTDKHDAFVADLKEAGNTNGMGLNFGLTDKDGKALIDNNGPDAGSADIYASIAEDFERGKTKVSDAAAQDVMEKYGVAPQAASDTVDKVSDKTGKKAGYEFQFSPI
jgi:hypothetical protein